MIRAHFGLSLAAWFWSLAAIAATCPGSLGAGQNRDATRGTKLCRMAMRLQYT